jgi:hypothetical protein
VTGISNFSLKPIRVQVHEKSPETEAMVKHHLDRFGQLKGQRSPDQYRIKEIKVTRELTRDPDYQPQFVNYPLNFEDIDVDLTEEDRRDLERLKTLLNVEDDDEAIRYAVFTWYKANFSEPNPFANKSVRGD